MKAFFTFICFLEPEAQNDFRWQAFKSTWERRMKLCLKKSRNLLCEKVQPLLCLIRDITQFVTEWKKNEEAQLVCDLVKYGSP